MDPETKKTLDEWSAEFHERMEAQPRREEVFNYENRFVAFLDILGFRNAMTGIAADSPNELFHTIVDSYWFWSVDREVTVQMLSDSIIVCSKDDHPASFISVANAVNALRYSFLERGLLLRGAVAFGRHFQSHGILISPALVEAHGLEDRLAIFPRILCAESVVRYVREPVIERNGRLGIPHPHMRRFYLLRDQLPTDDFDGLQTIPFLPDTLEVYFLRTGHHHDPGYAPTREQLEHFRKVGPEVLKRWRAGLEIATMRASTADHKQKVNYLVGKWNDYIRSFKELTDAEAQAFSVR